jgi:hypothetical protein
MTVNYPSDIELLGAIREGNQGAFRHLFETHFADVSRHIRVYACAVPVVQ